MTALLADPIAREHDTGPGHPEQIARWDAAVKGLGDRALTEVAARAAAFDELALCHKPAYIRLAQRDVQAGLGSLSTGDTDICPRSYIAATRACRTVPECRGSGDAGRDGERVLHRPAAGASCDAGSRDGVLSVQQRGNCGPICAAALWRGTGVDRRLGRSPWQRDAGRFLPGWVGVFFSTHQSPWYPGTGDLEELPATGRGNRPR